MIVLINLVFGMSLSAFATETTMLSEELAHTSSEVEITRGYLPTTREATVGACATGPVEFNHPLSTAKHFENPQFFVYPDRAPTRVTVHLSAVAKRMISKKLSPDTFRNEPVCGTQYVSGILKGTKISMRFDFYAKKAEEVGKLLSFLKANVVNLRSIYDLDFGAADIKLEGVTHWSEGSGISGYLRKKQSDCNWGGVDCKGYVEQAYLEAAKLDIESPDGTYFTPDVISFSVEDYPNKN